MLANLANACPRAGDKFDAWSADINGDGVPDVVLKGKSGLIVLSIDDLQFLPIPANVPGLTIESVGAGYVGHILTTAAAVGFSPIQGHYQLQLLTVSGNPCKSILLQATAPARPSLVVSFLGPGLVGPIQILSLADGASLIGLGASTGDANGDGSSDIYLRDGMVVRGVLIRDASGNYVLDAKNSALAVWNSFLDAVRAGNVADATAHLSSAGKSELASVFAEMGNLLPRIADNIVDIDVADATASAVVIQTIVRINPQLHRVYEAHIVQENGLWYLESL